MNLEKLLEAQRFLDGLIIEDKKLHGQYLFDYKLLALQVELGECANEWRRFKFWSNRREMNTKYWNSPEQRYENPLLEEFVDCLHFFLSIALEMEIKEHVYSNIKANTWGDTTKQFSRTFLWLSKLSANPMPTTWKRAFGHFIGLGELLGFTPEQIEQAYFEKNAINLKRQAEGY